MRTGVLEEGEKKDWQQRDMMNRCCQSFYDPIWLFLHKSDDLAFHHHVALLCADSHDSVEYIFPFLFCLLFLFFSHLFVKSPQKTTCLVAFIFVYNGFGHCLLYNVMNLCP